MSHKLNQIQNWPELALQAKWSVTALAKKCRVSRETLREHFLRQRKTHPRAWLAEQRQQYAAELLFAGGSIKETSASLNYKKPTNFNRAFKAFWGFCPSKLPEKKGESWQND
jgi:transcriptional regulator GlxA family with amidase domain